VLVAGSAVFNGGDYADAIAALRQAADHKAASQSSRKSRRSVRR
jgi:hypothetical protein